MQQAELIRYIEDPTLMDEKSLAGLRQLTQDFPYFQPAHILLSLSAKKWDTSLYQQSLRKTAIVVSNRGHLFNLIHQYENVLSAEKKTTAEKLMEPITVPEKEEVAAIQSPEETKQELDILKAAEISSEKNTVSEKEAEQKAKPGIDEQVEMEMGSQLVRAFVEKEILDTPGLHNPIKKEETPVSFNDWLTYMKNRGGEKVPAPEIKPEPAPEKTTTPPDQLQVRKQKNKAIIDRIIESSPGLIKVKEDQKFFTADNKAKESLQENEHLVTETLARIYALQGNVNKAVRAYEILSLKFPQKSAYFASLIQKLKNNK